MGAVGREFSGAGLSGVVLGASAATWVVLIFVVVLVLIGIALIITAIWVLQNADGDPEALRPLELMGSRRFRSADPAEQREQLAAARPAGAGAPAPIVASAAASPAPRPASSADDAEKTTGTRRVRRYRAGDRPPSADTDVEAETEAGTEAGTEAANSATSKRRGGKRKRGADPDVQADVVVDEPTAIPEPIDDLEADDDLRDDVEEDWWLDLDEETAGSEEPDVVATKGGARRARSGAGRDGGTEQSYLDVLADWGPDPDEEWTDEPDWTSSGTAGVPRPKAGDARRRADDELDDEFDDDGLGDDEFDDDEFDDDEFDDEFIDDDEDGLVEADEDDDLAGLAPAQERRVGGARSAGRWRRDVSAGPPSRTMPTDDDLDDDDFDDDDFDDFTDDDIAIDDDGYADDYDNDDYDNENYDEPEDNDMDFDDDDYDNFSAADTAPGSDPFFDDDYDGPLETASAPQRSERRPRRARSGPSGGTRGRRRVPSAGMNSFDPEAMVDRFRERAAAVRRRPLPPVAGEERQEFIRQAKLDYQDFAMIGDAEVSIEDGVLVLRLDLRAD